MSEDKQTLSMTLKEVHAVLDANHWRLDVEIDYAGRWYTITNLAKHAFLSDRVLVQLHPVDDNLLEETERFFSIDLDADKFRRVRYAAPSTLHFDSVRNSERKN